VSKTTKISPQSKTTAVHSFNGQSVHNFILSNLPPREREAVFSKMEFVDLPIHTVLSEMFGLIKYGYFINSGLSSVLNVMSDGKRIEVGLTGKEGFVGLPLAVGFKTSPTLTIIQIAATGFRVGTRDLENIFRTCPELVRSLNRYTQELALQQTQVAACNRLHDVEERLARWLLMSQDRVESPSFLLTQEFLSHMLGTRRASVTVAAGVLQKAGLITYKRGQVHVRNRSKLEKSSCECYQILNRQMECWRNNSH
jgi:CRP-like cAMP-binding protein